MKQQVALVFGYEGDWGGGSPIFIVLVSQHKSMKSEMLVRQVARMASNAILNVNQNREDVVVPTNLETNERSRKRHEEEDSRTHKPRRFPVQF